MIEAETATITITITRGAGIMAKSQKIIVTKGAQKPPPRKDAIMAVFASAPPPETITPTEWDRGAGGKANQADLVEESRPFIDPETGRTVNPNGIRGNRRQTWVARYAKAGKLNSRQHMAALSLSDAAIGMPAQDPLAALGIRGQGRSDPEAARIDARREFRRLWSFIPNHCRAVVERVVINDSSAGGGALGGSGTNRQMILLWDGLDAVANATH